MTSVAVAIRVMAIREMLDVALEYGRYEQVRNACIATYGDQLVAQAEREIVA